VFECVEAVREEIGVAAAAFPLKESVVAGKEEDSLGSDAVGLGLDLDRKRTSLRADGIDLATLGSLQADATTAEPSKDKKEKKERRTTAVSKVSEEIERQRDEEEVLKRQRYVAMKLVMLNEMAEGLRADGAFADADAELKVLKMLLEEHELWDACAAKRKRDKKAKKEKKEKKSNKADDSGASGAAPASEAAATPATADAAIEERCECTSCKRNDEIMESLVNLSSSDDVQAAYARETQPAAAALQGRLGQLSLAGETMEMHEGTFVNADGIVVDRYVYPKSDFFHVLDFFHFFFCLLTTERVIWTSGTRRVPLR
jgi:hypothetical protein